MVTLIRLIQLQTKDSHGDGAHAHSRKMKISLFIKPSILRVYIFVLVVYMGCQPHFANAGFFSNLMTKMMGTETQASEIPVTDDQIHNSQNLPLLESSINPDVKNIKDEPVIPSLSFSNEITLSNTETLGSDSNLEKYASSAKFSTYIVKSGDTLEVISNKLKISKNTILASNADLKKSDLLKIGQKLVILPLKDQKVVDKFDDTLSKKEKKIKITPVVLEKFTEKVVKKVDASKSAILTPTVNKNITLSVAKVSVTPAVVVAPVVTTTTLTSQSTSTVVVQGDTVTDQKPVELTTPMGQPTGTIKGGYIWPLPAGVGRVSQGLHADAAFDFAAPKDTPIYAVQDGIVFIVHSSGYNGGFGKYIVINFTDGRQAIFAHMNKTAVEEGEVVKQGDMIGYVGSTGHSTGHHLHLGFHGDLGNPYIGLKVNSTDLIKND